MAVTVQTGEAWWAKHLKRWKRCAIALTNPLALAPLAPGPKAKMSTLGPIFQRRYTSATSGAPQNATKCYQTITFSCLKFSKTLAKLPNIVALNIPLSQILRYKSHQAHLLSFWIRWNSDKLNSRKGMIDELTVKLRTLERNTCFLQLGNGTWAYNGRG